MHNVYMFQPQYALEFGGEDSFYLPYSVGCLWSYVSQFEDIKKNFELKDIIFRRERPEDILDRMEDPVLCGFSCYIWNKNYCLKLAEMIKKRWPKCVIQFGGAESNGKLIKHDFVDSVIMGEGEEPFLKSLRGILEGKPPELFYEKKRLDNLEIPSPYTTGIFDKIIANNPKAKWAMTFETNRGCPYQCTFCDWGGLTYNKIKRFGLEKIQADLEWAVSNPITYMICADANFGIFKERDLEIARLIKSAADRGCVEAVNLQYAKNSTEIVFEIAKTMGNYSRGITVSVQSMNTDTLDAIKRKNLDINNVHNLMRLSQEHNVLTYTEVILGLPLETLETWKQGFADILEMGQHNSIDMWFGQLLENSELFTPESRQKYGIKSIMAKDYMPFYNKGDWREIDEDIELVNETATMPTSDMVEGYMYGWLVIHFHTNGYTQWLAKYCRNIKNIPYRQFYDRLWELVQTTDLFAEHYQEIKTTVSEYLRTGIIPKDFGRIRGGHGIHAASYEFMYTNKTKIYALAKECAKTWNIEHAEIEKLSSSFIFDPNINYPVSVKLDFDLLDWKPGNYIYEVKPIRELDIDKMDFYALRRQGLLKNRILKH